MSKSLKWEELTAPDFARTVKQTQGVCLVPLGVIEKHGQHLPLGTDLIQVRQIAQAAAALEPTLIFPPYFFTQIHCGKHQPGTLALPFRLIFDLLDATCEEISRNGCKKIILVNGHGGNNNFLPYFGQYMLEKHRDFMLYIAGIDVYFDADHTPEWKTLRQSTIDGHGGEVETSMMMATTPELVYPERVTESGLPQNRVNHLDGLYNGIWWYADYPNHFQGEAKTASAEKGRFLINNAAQRLAKLIRIAKADRTCARLTREFFARTRHGAK